MATECSIVAASLEEVGAILNMFLLYLPTLW